MKSWFTGVLDGQAADPVPVLSVVPHRSILGPIVLPLFINDLLDNIKTSEYDQEIQQLHTAGQSTAT